MALSVLAVAGAAAVTRSDVSRSDAIGGLPPVQRISGADRFATAAAASAASFPQGAPIAFVATGADYPDALTAAAAAGGRGPVLLVRPRLVPQATADELRRLAPARVVLVGGDHAVSAVVMATVEKIVPNATVVRIAGSDRYATAATLSQVMFPNGAPVVYVATGSFYSDALAAAAAAAAGKGPVLLARPGELPRTTATELRRLGASMVHMVGGVGALSDDVFSAVGNVVSSATVDRLSGDDRFGTAARLSARGFPYGADVAYVATAADYPDALSAASSAATVGPVLLVSEWTVPRATSIELSRLGVGHIVVVGGSNAVSDSVLQELGSLVTTTPASIPPPPPVSSRASTAVATARQQLGKPYQWGGAGPDAFDCSGLTMFAWAAAGVSLPHNAEAQAEKLPPVQIADLQPGDLVFYGTPGNIGHVGLYIGSGQMIEAEHTGVPVQISDIKRPDLLIGGRPT